MSAAPALMPQWTTALPNWESLIVAKQSINPVGALYPAAANQALDVMTHLVMSDLANKPLLGQVTLPWALDFAKSIFGAYDQQTGIRHISEFFLLISKKNSKSTLAAAIMLTALILNWREGAYFMIIAPTKKIAGSSFNQACGMIRNDPLLSKLLHVRGQGRVIQHRTTNAILEIVAADSDVVTGSIATGVLIEEVHEFGKREKSEAMFLEAKGGLASRPDGFVIYLTTHSEEPPAGVMRDKLNYARGVRDGRIHDPKFLPILYEFPKWMLDAELHKRPENFYVTNPNLGFSVSEAYLISEFQAAEETGESALRNFMAKHLNVEVGLNLRSDRWAGADYWEQQGQNLSLDDILARSDVVVVGGDGGGLDDLLGMAVLGRDKETREWLHWGHAWCHRGVLERRKIIASRLQDYEKAGDLSIIDNINDDCREFGEICAKIDAAGLLHEIGLDPLMLGGLLDGIVAAGIDESKMRAVAQGYRLAGYIQTTERKLAAGELLHGGSAMMAWCVGNAKMEVRGNNALMTKQASGKAKIDPVIALLNAVAVMSENPEPLDKKYEIHFI